MTKRKVITIRQPDAETRPVVGYEGLYAVTNDGRLWTAAKPMGVSRHGGRWLKPGLDSAGYPMVMLFKEKQPQMCRVHRIVATAWIPNASELPEVNHINAIKADNRVENLEWCTGTQNRQHAVNNGLVRRGSLPDEAVTCIRELVAGGAKQKDVAVRYQVSKNMVSLIVNRLAYHRVPAGAQPGFSTTPTGDHSHV